MKTVSGIWRRQRAFAVRMHPWRWALGGGLAGALVALALCAPADWLAHGVGNLSGGRVQLHNAQGTLWRGDAQLVLAAGDGGSARYVLPGRWHWRLRPLWLGLGGSVRADCCMATSVMWRLQRRAGSMRLEVSQLAMDWPAASLQGLGAPWNTLQPQGTLRAHAPEVTMTWSAGRMILSGQVQVDALDVSSALSTVEPLGSYRLVLEGGEGGAAPQFGVQTLHGPLQLQGQGQWLGGRLRFSGEAQPRPGSEAALDHLLTIIGRRQGARALIRMGQL